jgi:hypothetical protein
MKMKAIFATLATLFFCLTLVSGDLLAQTDKANKTNKTTATPKVPYCDEVLKREQDAIQKKADETCQTVTTCVDCTERKTSIRTCAYLIAQPRKGMKGNCAVATVDDSSKDDAKFDDDTPSFRVDIIQYACPGKGVTLVAHMPAYSPDPKGQSQFSFLWEVDGKKAGHDNRVECACGKKATVRVTNLATNVAMTKTATITPCIDDK